MDGSLSTNWMLAFSPDLRADFSEEIVRVGAVVPTGINRVDDAMLPFPALSLKAPARMFISPVMLLPMGGVKVAV